jgi:hypothetical protein
MTLRKTLKHAVYLLISGNSLFRKLKISGGSKKVLVHSDVSAPGENDLLFALKNEIKKTKHSKMDLI